MKYFFLFSLLIPSINALAQSPVNRIHPVHEFDVTQFHKSYHAATVVEVTGIAIAFAGAGFAEEASGKTAIGIFGSSIAFGGLIYSLLSSGNPTYEFYDDGKNEYSVSFNSNYSNLRFDH